MSKFIDKPYLEHDMSFKTVQATTSVALVAAGTVVIGYPDETNAGSFFGATGHKLATGSGDVYTAPGNFTVTFGASSITLTSVDMALPAETKLYVELQMRGEDDGDPTPLVSDRVFPASLVTINLGAPDTIDVNGVFEAVSQAAGAITLDGALGDGSTITFDVPRNIVVDSGGADTATITFVGTDEPGNAMSEAITLNGTTAVSGKKAFKTITSASCDATISNGAFAGNGDVLGLPVFLPKTGMVLKELQNGAAPTAGTVVAGVTTVATTTTGDVRGTYDPNAACDGAKVFELICALEDPAYLGITQA
jgi:hypothetical protein